MVDWLACCSIYCALPSSPAESRIKYFKTEKSVKPLGVIDLGLCRGIRKTAAAKSNRPFSFDLMTVHRTFAVAAESSAELDSWLEAVADSVPDDPAPKSEKQIAATQSQVYSILCLCLFVCSFFTSYSLFISFLEWGKSRIPFQAGQELGEFTRLFFFDPSTFLSTIPPISLELASAMVCSEQ